MNLAFWKNRRVFITGHTGFKGSWLCVWLQHLGARVVGYSLPPPTDPSMFELVGVQRGMTSLEGDVRELRHISRALKEAEPEIVLHLAAQSIVRESYEDPIETYSTNVLGTVTLFEAIRQLGLSCTLVNVTSDKCYENRGWQRGYREDDRLGGHDPYSNSKACAELVTAAFRDSFFAAPAQGRPVVHLASARAGNVIGGGDWTKHQLLPDIVQACMAARPVSIRNPHAIRPWQFVLEPLRGYLVLAEALWREGEKFAGGWNFGPDDADAQTVGWITEQVTKRWGEGASWVHDQGNHPHEAELLKLDASKSRAMLNWSPVMTLEEGLDWVVEWYRAYQHSGDLFQLTLDQISRYEERVAPRGA